MKARFAGNFHEPYVRGPHFRYFFVSIMIGFVIAMLTMAGLLSVIRLF